MKPRSETNTVASGVIAVVGGMIMGLFFEAERMPALDESLDASSLAYKPRGYRAQHNRLIEKPADKLAGFKPIEQPIVTKTEVNVSEPNTNEDDERIEIGVCLNTDTGDDPFGRQLKKNLHHNGVEISGVRRLSNEMTGTCAVFVEKFTGTSRDIGYPGAKKIGYRYTRTLLSVWPEGRHQISLPAILRLNRRQSSRCWRQRVKMAWIPY